MNDVEANVRRGGDPIGHFRDAAVLLAVIVASSSFYALELGRYSDDWWFYRHLLTSPDQSWGGFYETLANVPWLAVRPGQIAWYATFQALFPDDVTAVHLANHAVFAFGALMLHAALRVMPATRTAAYPVTLIYICMAHFTASKFWYANHMATLSFMLFAATALSAALLAHGPRRGPAIVLVCTIGLGAAASILCYELFCFMLPLLPLAAWQASGRSLRETLADGRFRAATLVVALAFAAAALLKLGYSDGATMPSGWRELLFFGARTGRLYLQAGHTTFWTLALFLPRAALGVATGPHAEPAAVLAALLALGLMVGRAVLARAAPPRDPRSGEARWDVLVAVGALLWGLGYAPFLLNFYADPYAWGEVNRVNIAGGLGAAIAFCGALRWLEGKSRPAAQAALMAFCTLGIFLQVATARMWIRAAERQEEVVAGALAATAAIGGLRERDTVLVYGLCPYVGVAAVLRSPDDTAPRLMLASGRRALTADLIQPDSRLTPDGIRTDHYDRLKGHYPYRSLIVFDLPGRAATRIESFAEAKAFFAAHPIRDSAGCDYVRGRGTALY